MRIEMGSVQVRQIRNRLKLTQTEFAKRLGVTQTAISYWEDGKRTPRGPAVILLKSLASGQKEK